MLPRALSLLRCPECLGRLRVLRVLAGDRHSGDIERGILACAAAHHYPIVGGVPRMEIEALGHYRDVFLAEKHALTADEHAVVERAPKNGTGPIAEMRNRFS